MGFKYRDTCYDTLAEAIQSEADQCGLTINNSSGYYWVGYCEVNGSNIQFLHNNTASSTFYTSALTYTPSYPSCTANSGGSTFSNADIIELSWLVVSVWVVAWGFRKMIEVFKK